MTCCRSPTILERVSGFREHFAASFCLESACPARSIQMAYSGDADSKNPRIDSRRQWPAHEAPWTETICRSVALRNSSCPRVFRRRYVENAVAGTVAVLVSAKPKTAAKIHAFAFPRHTCRRAIVYASLTTVGSAISRQKRRVAEL